MAEVLSVSALNRYVKARLDGDDFLFDLALRGEIANFVQNARSGHCYFSLRDEQAAVKAVMFRSDARRMSFRPEEGMRVVVRCRATLYERDGAFQIYVNEMFPDGIGAAQLALEQLKARLAAEGLFDPDHKKPLPAYPQCIGVVTSRTGAALQDIRNVIGRRWPLTRLLLCPVNVQGFEAADQIAAAIDRLDKSGRADVILVARGGGSREDLWVFNAEKIARAAYRCKTPLVSAIGHEIDFTLLDFVADLRAPTPSAAAELAVPDRGMVQNEVDEIYQNIYEIMQNQLEVCYNKYNTCADLLEKGIHRHILDGGRAELTRLEAQLPLLARTSLNEGNRRLRHAAALADSLSPYRVLARGYAVVCDSKGEVRTVGQLCPGETVTLRGAHHTAVCKVTSVEETDESAQNL